jgi:hypothetical protein
MKSIRITIILFSFLAVIACNNQQSKKADAKSSVVIKTTSEKPIRKKTENPEQKDLRPCENLVKEILTTSARYRQLTKGLNQAIIKNGGLYFGVSMEGSPNRGHDETSSYSKTYDFTVYEMYTDRQLNTARFSFNPENKQLYEYDAVHDQFIPIEFDRNLVKKYETLCK